MNELLDEYEASDLLLELYELTDPVREAIGQLERFANEVSLGVTFDKRRFDDLVGNVQFAAHALGEAIALLRILSGYEEETFE